ncbi:MAG: GGDEF domain-containing protein [Gammaproteobacteria bacterium]|nr:GGDEF domain-containing protein [Gammaproteobacteria bacterium]
MNNLFSNRITKLLPPVLLLGASLWSISRITLMSPAWQLLLTEALPLISITIAMLLSIRFNRSRYSFLLVFLALAGLSQTIFRGQLLPATENLLFAALIANSFIFSFFKDRSLISIHGLVRICFLSIQACIIWYIGLKAPGEYLSLLNSDLLTLPDSISIFVQLPDPIVIAALFFNLVHMSLSIARNSSIQATFFGCQLGLLGIASGYPHAAFVPFLITSCALMVAMAIILDSYDMAYRDELTALPSRRALNQSLLNLGRHYTIAMLDIDHFKKFNDTHGHDTGDEVLKMVACKIARIGGGGKPFRYGGEEFAIVFTGKSPEQTAAHLEALRKAIESYKMVVRQGKRGTARASGKQARVRRGKNDPKYKSLSVTISIGYAERNAEWRMPEAVIKAADLALYRAKNQGRNCISV